MTLSVQVSGGESLDETLIARDAALRQRALLVQRSQLAQRNPQEHLLRNAVVDVFSSNGKLFDRSTEAVNQAQVEYQQALKTGSPNLKEAYARLGTALNQAEKHSQDYRGSLRTVAGLAGTVTSVAVTVGTGGLGGPFVSGAVEVATKAAILGPDYAPSEAVKDFAIGTVAGSAGNLGQRVATSAIPGASLLPKLARGAVTGASSGTVQQGLTTATAPETWKDGALAGAGKVAKSAANGALIGATVGTATTALVEGGTRVVQAAQARLQSSTAREINSVETLPGSKSPASASTRDPHRKPPGEDWYQATEGSDEKAWIKLKSGQDGKGTWIQEWSGGRFKASRVRKQNGAQAFETVQDGTHSVKFSRSSLLNSVWEDKQTFTINGREFNVRGAKGSEFEFVKWRFERLPEKLRNSTRDVAIVDTIESVSGRDGFAIGGNVAEGIDEKASTVLLARQPFLGKPSNSLGYTLVHELSHNQDRTPEGLMGRFSDNKLFGQGVSVTKYGQTNAAEDFAETGVVVLKDLPRYKAMSVSEWAKEPFAEKKLSYAQAIGLEVPSFQDVLAAMKQ